MHVNKSPHSAEGAYHSWKLVALLGSTLVLVTLLLQRRQLVGVELTKSLASNFEGDDSIRHPHALDGSGSAIRGTGSLRPRPSSVGDRQPTTTASCSLAVEQSPLADSCTLLRDACVDQGNVILYDKQDAKLLWAADGPGYELIEPLPDFEKFIFLHRSSGAQDNRFRANAVRVRPAATAEGTLYLQDPIFSSCTVPVIWYPFERVANFAHVFRDNGAKLLGALRDTSWWQHTKLVLVTAEGLALPPWNYDILQPLSPLKIETWADFSNRLPAQQTASGSGYVPIDSDHGGDADSTDMGLPLSSEGGPQRCFRHMLVCNGGVNHSAWPLHGMGQHLVRHYHDLLPAAIHQLHEHEQQQEQQDEREEEDKQQQQQELNEEEADEDEEGEGGGIRNADDQFEGGSGSSATVSSSGNMRGERVLRVLFHKRSGPDRQLLNVAELIRRCNSWRYTSKAGQQLRASCAEVELTSLLTGMAAAQDADVFVGVHGANMANAWLMRPGSSMIELQPYGFDESPAHLQYPLFNARDNETAVLWWVISVCDPKLSTPGTEEAQGEGSARKWAKNRNLRVGWSALREVLETAVDVGGNMMDYWQRWQEGRWWWWLRRGGDLTLVGPGRVNHMRCPKDGEGAYRNK